MNKIKENLKNRTNLLLQFINIEKGPKLYLLIFLLLCIYKISILTLILWYLMPVEKFVNTKNKTITTLFIFAILSLFVIYPMLYGTAKVIGEYHPIQKIKIKSEQNKIAAENEKKLKEQQKAATEQERIKLLKSSEEDLNKIFCRIDFKQHSKKGLGTYDFYINPLIWAKLDLQQKETLHDHCTAYTYLRLNTKEKIVQYCVKIKSSSNGEVLAKYSHNGFECK